MDSLTQIRSRIDTLLARGDSVLVAIDGSCAAGKSTLADTLSRLYDCNVLHMDDYFLRPHQRTRQRMEEPGGNVDYVRFRQEVLEPLTRGEPVSFRRYDCRTQTLSDPIRLPHRQLTLVEGTYSCHPHFGNVYDLRIFLDISPELRRQRILQRPVWKHSLFFEVWIPMEQTYFDTYSIKERCHILCSAREALCD